MCRLAFGCHFVTCMMRINHTPHRGLITCISEKSSRQAKRSMVNSSPLTAKFPLWVKLPQSAGRCLSKRTLTENEHIWASCSQDLHVTLPRQCFHHGDSHVLAKGSDPAFADILLPGGKTSENIFRLQNMESLVVVIAPLFYS